MDIDQLKKEASVYEKKIKDMGLQLEEFADFLENASVPIHRVNSEGVLIWANQAELELVGYPASEYIGFPIVDFHAEPDLINDIINRLNRNEDVHEAPAVIRCKDGTLKHVLISSSVFKKNGQFIHTRCFTRDVTPFVNEQERTRSLLSELRESEARVRMAVELTNLGTWDYSPLTGKLNWSAECRKIYGYPLNDPVEFAAFEQGIYPEDKDRVLKAIQTAITPGGSGSYNLTFRIVRFDDGSLRWIKTQGAVYFNTDGEAERFIGTVVDITDNKLALDHITRSEELFRTIALNIPNSLIMVVNKDHNVVIIEGDLMERMGFDRRNYEGKHLSEVSPPERYEASKILYERVFAGEKFSVERKAETGEDYIVHFVPLKDKQDEVYAGLVIALDISQIKKAEENSAKLAAIIESTDDAIISKTLESVITSWNDSAVRTFGYSAGDMIGQSIMKIIPDDRKDEELQILSRLRNGERVEHFETKRLTSDNRLLDVSLTISPVKNAAGEIIGLSKIVRDITEKKQEEQRKNDFIAMVSHELKTPLTSMKAYLQILLAKAEKNNDQFTLNALSRADVQAQKMTVMIQDFLSLARLEDGKIELNKELFDLGRLMEEVVADVRLLTSTHQIELNACDHQTVNADRDKIGQVLNNLLSNAIKYSPKGSTITVGCSARDSSVKVYVSDKGIGISAADQKRLFERFYRVNNGKLKTVSGFGIGLFLVSEILRYHGSTIEVESLENVGSTFCFALNIVNNVPLAN
jgi:PAS domain S-box-containing protein